MLDLGLLCNEKGAKKYAVVSHWRVEPARVGGILSTHVYFKLYSPREPLFLTGFSSLNRARGFLSENHPPFKLSDFFFSSSLRNYPKIRGVRRACLVGTLNIPLYERKKRLKKGEIKFNCTRYGENKNR